MFSVTLSFLMVYGLQQSSIEMFQSASSIHVLDGCFLGELVTSSAVLILWLPGDVVVRPQWLEVTRGVCGDVL